MGTDPSPSFFPFDSLVQNMSDCFQEGLLCSGSTLLTRVGDPDPVFWSVLDMRSNLDPNTVFEIWSNWDLKLNFSCST